MPETGTEPPIHRAAVALSRRASLLVLGGAALGAAPPASLAGKRKKGQKRVRQIVKKTCRRQSAECRETVEDHRVEADAPDFCRTRFLECCDPLTTCDARASTACFLNFDGEHGAVRPRTS